MILRRAWRRKGEAVVTCEGFYQVRTDAIGNGKRQVFDLLTGSCKLVDGIRERIWFLGRSAPFRLNSDVLDLCGARNWWESQVGQPWT